MQPGEAYCMLNAVMTHLSRQFSTDPGLLAVLGQGAEACAELGKHLTFQPPSANELVPYLEVLDRLKGSVKPTASFTLSKDAYESASRREKPVDVPVAPSGDTERALKVLDSMIEDFDEAPDAAEDYVNGIKPVVLDMREKIGRYKKCSEKQMNYIDNMRRGLDKWFRGRRDLFADDAEARHDPDDDEDIPF